eukprot:TRINITY_DN5907_c0_g1_i1.p1 TRINITY_DN5907_c0_g1~~TRINITY_DN5907_c0_g1_i1.p1  ORF type:complete len:969 (-),score=179.77 TRINITY_DN5907_c0_g1_i1:104-3010(-)
MHPHLDWKSLLGPYVVNEALIRDLNQRRRTWIRPLGEDEALPSSKLFSVFDDSGTAAKKVFRLKRLEREFADHCHLLQHDRVFPAFRVPDSDVGKLSVVPCLDLFQIKFDVFTNGVLKGIKFDGSVIIGGSSVLACLLPLPEPIFMLYKEHLHHVRAIRSVLKQFPSEIADLILEYWDNPFEKKLRSEIKAIYEESWSKSDIDIFLVVKDFQQAEDKLREVCEKVRSNIPFDACFVRTANTVSICSKRPYRHVQIVTSVFRSIEEFMIFPDLDCVSCVYDGSNVYATPRGIRALNYKTNFLEPNQISITDTPRRIRKYTERGFPSMIFELCKHLPRCDIELNPKITELAGSFMNSRRRENNGYSDVLLPTDPGFDAISIKRSVESRLWLHWHKTKRGLQALEALEAQEGQTTQETGGSEKEEKETNSQKEKEDEVPLPQPTPEELTEILSFPRASMKSLDKLFVPRRSAGTTILLTPARTKKQNPNKPRALQMLRRPVLIPFKWKYESSRYLLKPEAHPRTCYICSKFVKGDEEKETQEGQQEVKEENDEAKEKGVHEENGGVNRKENEVVLCRDCEATNRKHRETTVDLHGKIALVTGGRIKIGYETALKLLRCGATVIVVTRFPRDAARKFFSEPDSEHFRDRVHVYGVDLRHVGLVSQFIHHVKTHYHRLDILINNAAQTIRRPPAYYRRLCKTESKLAEDDDWIDIMTKHVNENPWSRADVAADKDRDNSLAIESALKSFALISSSISFQQQFAGDSRALITKISEKFSTVAPSAALTQIPLLASDVMKDPVNFPSGQVDMYGEQLDLRRETTWVQNVESVDPVEVAEVQLVNSVVPFMFISQLTGLLAKSPERAFVVNVSSPEGQFSASKSGEHVHTNMAKAALNMMTLTVARDLELKNIYVTAVDTGWVSRMRPGVGNNNSLDAPLSPADGAARVLHPVLDGYGSEKPLAGVFLKNFVVSNW